MSDQFEFNWDEIPISDDGDTSNQETVILPDGNYDFTVIKVEEGIYEPRAGSSLPKCGMAKVYMRIDGGDRGNGLAVENIYVTPRNEWKVSAFLRCIGLKKRGETVMADKLLHCDGERGRCQIKIDTYTTSSGETRQNNKVVRFYDPQPKEAAPAKKWAKGAF